MIFKPGDKVKLVGSPIPMVIEEIEKDEAICVWMDGNSVFRNSFKLVTLAKWPDQGPVEII